MIARLLSIDAQLDRRRLRQRAEAAERRLASFAASVSVIYFEYDTRAQRLTYVSAAFERIMGRSCDEAYATACPFLAQAHPEDRSRVAVSAAPCDDLEFRIIRPDGGVRTLRRQAVAEHDTRGRIVRLVGSVEDVTTLREAQRQAAASARLETLGRLVGGVAHDFNNMLTAIICEAEHLKRKLPHDDPRHSGAQQIIGSSIRAADLARQLLAVGRPRAYEPQEIDVNHMVDGLERLLRRLSGSDVTLEASLTSEHLLVRGELSQLEQVVINLVLNARDAIAGEGRVRIVTHATTEHVILSVEDNGTGMTDEVRGRIFEPFFTTKGPDAGTGLGLCSARDIVERMGGSIAVHSKVGRGTTFDVYLPRADAQHDTTGA